MIPDNSYEGDHSSKSAPPPPPARHDEDGVNKYAASRMNIDVSGNCTQSDYFIETELLPGERIISEFMVEMPPPVNMFKFILRIILSLGIYLLFRVICASCIPVSVTNKKYRMSLTSQGRILVWCLNIDGQQAASFTWVVTRFLCFCGCGGKCNDFCQPGREYACLSELYAFSVSDIGIIDHESGRKEIPILANLCPTVFRFSRNVLNLYLRRYPDPGTFISDSFFGTSRRVMPTFKGEGSYSAGSGSSLQALAVLGKKTLLMMLFFIFSVAFLIGTGQVAYGVLEILFFIYLYAFIAADSSSYSVNTNLADERHHNNSVKITVLSSNHDVLHADHFAASNELCAFSRLLIEMKKSKGTFAAPSSSILNDQVPVHVSNEDVPVIDLSLSSILTSTDNNIGKVTLSTLNVPLTESDISLQAAHPSGDAMANSRATIPYYGHSAIYEWVLTLVIVFFLFFVPFAVFGEVKAGLGLGITFGIIAQGFYYFVVIRTNRGTRGVILLFKDRIVEYSVISTSGVRSSIDSTYAMNCTSFFFNNDVAYGQMKVSGDTTSGRICDVFGNRLEFVGIGKKLGQAGLQLIIRYFHSCLTANATTCNKNVKKTLSAISTIRPISAYGGDANGTDVSDSTNITALLLPSPSASTIAYIDSPKKYDDVKLGPFVSVYAAWLFLFTITNGTSTKSSDYAFLLWWITVMLFQVENWALLSVIECKMEFGSSGIFGHIIKRLVTLFLLLCTLGRYPHSSQAAIHVSDEVVQFIKRKSNLALLPWYRLNRPFSAFAWDKCGLFSRFKGQYDVCWIPTIHVRGVSLFGQVEGQEVCLTRYFDGKEPYSNLCPLMSTVTRIVLVTTHQDGDKELNFVINIKKIAASTGSLEDDDIRHFRSKVASIASLMTMYEAMEVEGGAVEVSNAGNPIYGYMSGGILKQPGGGRPESATTSSSTYYEKEMM